MTKKDFIDLANAMRASKPESFGEQGISLQAATLREARHNQWRDTSESIASALAESNPRFDRQRWLAYIDRKQPASHLQVEDRTEYAPSIRKGAK